MRHGIHAFFIAQRKTLGPSYISTFDSLHVHCNVVGDWSLHLLLGLHFGRFDVIDRMV